MNITEALNCIGPDGASAALKACPHLRQAVLAERGGVTSAVLRMVENDVILEMREQGCKVREISEVIGLPRRSIYYRIDQINASKDGLIRSWTEREDAVLRSMVAKGFKAREIARELRRSTGAVNTRKNILHITRYCIKPWTEEQLATLLNLWCTNTRIDEICRRTGGRTRTSVHSKARRLGLTQSHMRGKIIHDVLWRELAAREGRIEYA